MRLLYTVLLLSLPVWLFSDYVFSDQEYNEMVENQKIIDETLEQNEKDIIELEKTNESLKENNETEQKHLNKIIELQEKQITELEIYSAKQKELTLTDKIWLFIQGLVSGSLVSLVIYINSF